MQIVGTIYRLCYIAIILQISDPVKRDKDIFKTGFPFMCLLHNLEIAVYQKEIAVSPAWRPAKRDRNDSTVSPVFASIPVYRDAWRSLTRLCNTHLHGNDSSQPSIPNVIPAPAQREGIHYLNRVVTA